MTCTPHHDATPLALAIAKACAQGPRDRHLLEHCSRIQNGTAGELVRLVHSVYQQAPFADAVHAKARAVQLDIIC